MDNLLRYNYYVDNMPIDDIQGLETQIQTAVLDRVAAPFDKAQIDPLMEEMNTNFTKLQNQVLFKKHLASGADTKKMLSKDLVLDFKRKGPAPQFGRIQLKRDKEVVALNLGKIMRLDAKSFEERFKAFGVASLYSVKEVVVALDKIKQECLELKRVQFFDLNFVSGYTRLEDFKHAQESCIHKGLRKIVDGFPSKVHEAIKGSLRIGKDNKCTLLDQGRLRRFLELAQHMMKDALL